MGKRGNGEGSIYYSEKLKRWVGQYTYNGKRKSVYGKTRTEVRDKLNNALVNISNNKYVDKSKFTLLDIITMNVEEEFKSNKIAQTTYHRKQQIIKMIKKSDIANLEIQKINSIAINDYLLTISDYSNSTITKVSQMIRKAFNKALLLNIISTNPYNIDGLIIVPKSSKNDKDVEALTIDEQNLLIKELEKGYNKYADIMYIALYTGMRIGEILALYPKDIDLKNNIIHIRNTLTKDKNGKVILGNNRTKTYDGTRDIPITYLFKDILVKCLNNENKLIFTDNNKLINPNTINSNFKRVCKNAGIKVITKPKKKETKKGIIYVNLKDSDVNEHMLRHTYATRCIESGMSAVVLSKLLGHKDIETTLNTYTSVFNKFKQDEVQKYLDYMSSCIKIALKNQESA